MKSIAVIPNQNKDVGLVVTGKLVNCLKGRANVYMERLYEAGRLPVHYVQSNIYDLVDAVIILGGDGTILQAAEPCARRQIPILGINLGRIGFMSEVEEEDIDRAVELLLSGSYRIEKRMMMKVTLSRDGVVRGSFHALNDVVVSKAADAKLIGMELYNGGEKINAYVGDGLILSTPTGSTGYNLSAGGPVVNPLMQLFVASPICAHMLTARPAVMPADKPITIRLDGRGGTNEAAVSVDGDVRGYINAGDEVIVTRSQYETQLIKIGTQSFYDTLIQKLS